MPGDDAIQVPIQVLTGIEPTRLHQRIRQHDIEGSAIGDCFRTTIACLLGVDDPTLVPHFVEQTIRAGLDEHCVWEDIAAARRWLRANKGVDLALLDRAEADRIGCAYKAVVRSKSGPWNHSVVAQRGEVVWCPTTGDIDAGSAGDYTIDDLFPDEPVLVLCLPYDPDPDAQLAEWRSRDGEAFDAG